MPDYQRIYARQEYLTPGAPATVEIIAETVQPGERTWLLDLAAGKGEAAKKLQAKVDEVLNSADHKWYLNKMDPAEAERRAKAAEDFKKRYQK